MHQQRQICVYEEVLLKHPLENRKVLSANSQYQYMPPMNQINRWKFIWDYEGSKQRPRKKKLINIVLVIIHEYQINNLSYLNLNLY